MPTTTITDNNKKELIRFAQTNDIKKASNIMCFCCGGVKGREESENRNHFRQTDIKAI